MISVILGIVFLFWTVFLVYRARYLGYSPVEAQRIRGVITETCRTPIARLSPLPKVFVLWQRKQNWIAIVMAHFLLVAIPLCLMSSEAMGVTITVTGLIEGRVYFRFWGAWRTVLKIDCQRYLDRTRLGTEKLDGTIVLSEYRDLSSGHRVARVTHWKYPDSVMLRVFYGHDPRIKEGIGRIFYTVRPDLLPAVIDGQRIPVVGEFIDFVPVQDLPPLQRG